MKRFSKLINKIKGVNKRKEKETSNKIVIEPKNEDIDEEFFNDVVKDIESYIEEKYGNTLRDTTLQDSKLKREEK